MPLPKCTSYRGIIPYPRFALDVAIALGYGATVLWQTSFECLNIRHTRELLSDEPSMVIMLFPVPPDEKEKAVQYLIDNIPVTTLIVVKKPE